MDELVSLLIRNGQTMDHIFSEHKEDIPCSERTLYRYIDAGILSVKNIDLPRKVKYKPRKQSNTSEKLSRDCIAGRTYTEFLEYLESHPTKSESVIRVFRFLQNELGSETFSRLFPVILTDRGSEFSNPLALECDEYGEILSKVFFCNANAPYQKGRLEKNHEFLRYIIPKGTSFDTMTQDDITLCINHINSTARGSLNDRTPFELASMLLDVKLFELLHLKPVEPDSVLLKPALLWFSFSEQCHIAALTGTAGLQKAEKICTLHPAMTCDNPFSIACSHTGRASTLVPSKKLTPVV